MGWYATALAGFQSSPPPDVGACGRVVALAGPPLTHEEAIEVAKHIGKRTTKQQHTAAVKRAPI